MRAIFWGLFAVVAVAPLPLGGNRPLGWSLLSLSVGLLLILWGSILARSGGSLATPFRKLRGPFVLFTLSVAWVLIQLIPNVPLELAHPGWRELNIFFGTDVAARITIDPGWTRTILMRWLAYAGIFWLAVQLCRDRQLARQALFGFVLVATVYALYGIVTLFAFDNRILVYENWLGRQALSSTFVNRNSYATYAGLGLLAALAQLSERWMSTRRRATGARQRIVEFLSTSVATHAYLLVAIFTISTALLLTGSRGGVASTLVALFALLLLTRRSGGKASLSGVVAQYTTVVIVIGGVFALSSDLLVDRLQRGDAQRAGIYQQTWNAIDDHVYGGAGLGSFPQIFQLYRYEEKPNPQFVERAHNTYLENLVELGVPAALCLFLSIAWLAYICWRGLGQRSRDLHYAALGCASTLLVGLHSLVDFSLQIPAVTMTYMFLMGLAVAQSFSSRR